MRLTILVEDGSDNFVNIDVAPDMTIGLVKSLLEGDINISASKQRLFFNDHAIVEDAKTLEAVGVKEGDIMTVREAVPARRTAPAAQPPQQDDAETLRLQALGDPKLMRDLRNHRPELADAASDAGRFREAWDVLHRGQRNAEAEKQQTIARLNEDPMDVEAQMKIEEMIRQDAVYENLQMALQETPEIFGRVHMLYIPVEVNGHKIKAFVDSGAQATIMSPACAENCNIMRLIDKRFAGEARGVGTAKILGRVHIATIKIGSFFLPSSFTVMEGKDVDLLLGLDMLKRHQATIDLKKDCLRINEEETPFLSEGEIPQGGIASEPVVEGPGGTLLGGRSGALIAPEQEKKQPVAHASTSSQAQSSQTQQSSSQAPQQRSAQRSRYPKEHVDQLMSLGFTEEQVIYALDMAEGNPDVAAGILYG